MKHAFRRKQPLQTQAVVAEALESRQLLAITLDNGLLTVAGRGNNDTIIVSRNRDNNQQILAQVGKSKKTFAAAQVQRILVKGGDGNDKITLSDRNGAINLPVTVDGGNGNDSIVGGRGGERLLGNKGHDTITGNGGNDSVRGNDGNDVVLGGGGNDSVVGDKGNDLIYGDAGNDSLFGNDGKDTLGGDDEDRLSSASSFRTDTVGNDLLDGGAGDDWLLGGTRNERTLNENNGQDQMTGGPGNDIIDARGGDDTVTDKSAGDFVPLEDAPPAREFQGDVHTHAALRILVNGKAMFIPSEIGIFFADPNRFTSHLHTHGSSQDDQGQPANSTVIHFESPSATGYTLKEFFAVWGISFSSNHIGRNFNTGNKKVRVTVNGGAVKGFENYRPKDQEVIEITFR